MSRPSWIAVLSAAAILVIEVMGLVQGVAARGGGGGGGRGGGGGGGYSRGGGGINRGGPAAGGSFGQNRRAVGQDLNEYYRQGLADGSFGIEYPDQRERLERREELQEREELRDQREAAREERREDWPDYIENHIEDRQDDGSYGGYDEGYYGEGPVVYWTLPCTPNTIAMGGTVYYVCGSTWYVRAYSNGDVAYTVVPNPTGH